MMMAMNRLVTGDEIRFEWNCLNTYYEYRILNVFFFRVQLFYLTTNLFKQARYWR